MAMQQQLQALTTAMELERELRERNITALQTTLLETTEELNRLKSALGDGPLRGTAYAGGLSKEVQTRPAETPHPETSSQEDVNIGDAGEEEEQIAQHETSPTNLIAPRGHAHTMHPSASYNALVGQGYGVPAYSVQNPRKSVRRIAQPPQDFQVTVQELPSL